jgi:hypothetical protein
MGSDTEQLAPSLRFAMMMAHSALFANTAQTVGRYAGLQRSNLDDLPKKCRTAHPTPHYNLQTSGATLEACEY